MKNELVIDTIQKQLQYTLVAIKSSPSSFECKGWWPADLTQGLNYTL